ncbi:hypothetical protein C0Q88_26110 [Ralstonia pickettii]|uniref:Uncharacterized protein n=1 Tax=Ralstonia pickettii TaxID=329 RepID=A0A2N4TJ32_RALPI|nr:hypothetical protein [Ralstonia pickettii]PLC39723.1 hypothetical protein C0Q88_26110 [Ralstonia pickettii]
MNSNATELVIALATHVIGQMQTTFPGWEEAYVRFHAVSDFQFGVRASYCTHNGVELISTLRHGAFIDGVMRLGIQLREALSNGDNKFCVGLFRANSRFAYRMDYEWNDLAKWNITKLNGASGLPEGLEALAPVE